MRFKSKAWWPDDCCPDIDNYSEDTHDTRAQAQGVIDLLCNHGFGGARKHFPVKTAIEEIPQPPDERKLEEFKFQDERNPTPEELDRVRLLNFLALRSGQIFQTEISSSLQRAENYLQEIKMLRDMSSPEERVAAPTTAEQKMLIFIRSRPSKEAMFRFYVDYLFDLKLNRGEVAKILGIDPATLYRILKQKTSGKITTVQFNQKCA